MPYVVNALNRETGEPKTLWYDVDSEERALRLASDAGCVVENVKHVKGKTDPPPVPRPKSGIQREDADLVRGISDAESMSITLFILVGVLSSLVGGGLLIGALDGRFQTGNAIGATANALEILTGLAVLIFAVLCFVTASLILLRGTVRKAAVILLEQMKGE